jgi:1-acyl-sn-glycerol-3-phosphate acyltransferase
MKIIITFLHLIAIGIMNFIAKIILFFAVVFVHNVHYKNLKAVYSTRGPFLILPNHTNQWDPFLVSFPILRPIRWVASDAAFRDAFKTVLLLGGAIPKVKGTVGYGDHSGTQEKPSHSGISAVFSPKEPRIGTAGPRN